MAPEKQVRIDSDHTQTIKIVMYSKVSRLRASLRHGGQGVFFITEPPRGRPFGHGGIHRT